MGEQVLSSGDWKLSADKGELTKVLVGQTPFITKLGDFRVAGKGVRPFVEVAELREKGKNFLVYEGISDDGEDLYVEFGQVVELGKGLDFLLFMSWLPPAMYPADAAQGTVEFAPTVVDLKKADIPPGEAVIPGTQDFVALLKDGERVKIRAIGLEAEKTNIVKTGDSFAIRFQETRDYLRDISKLGKRLMSRWMHSTGTHYVRFIFTIEE